MSQRRSSQSSRKRPRLSLPRTTGVNDETATWRRVGVIVIGIETIASVTTTMIALIGGLGLREETGAPLVAAIRPGIRVMIATIAAKTTGPIVIATGIASVKKIVDGIAMMIKTLDGTGIVTANDDTATTSTAAQGTRLIRLDMTETVILAGVGRTIKE